MSYLQVLSDRLAAAGWQVASSPPRGREVLAASHGDEGVVFLLGDGLAPEEVRSDVARWRAASSRRTNLIYLFAQPLTPPVEQAIRAGAAGSVLTGFLDLHAGQAWIRPGLGQAALRAALRAGEVPAEQRRTEELLDVLAGTTPRGTWALIALCVVMFVWAELSGGTETIPVLLRFGANYGPLTQAGEWWRLVGAMFMHIGWMHLAMNMYSLWIVGPILERFMGTLRFLAMYAVAGVGGSLASVMLGSGNISAGASGAVFGVFGATAFLGWRWRDAIPAPLRKQLLGGMVPTILFNLFIGSTVAGIDNRAHIGGLVSGVAFTALVPPRITLPRLPAVVLPLIGALAAAPFAVEAYVAWRAATVSPYVTPASVTWTVPGTDLSIRHSPIFEVRTVEGTTFLSTFQMSLLASAQPVATFQALQGELAAEVAGPLETVPAGGRDWLVGRRTEGDAADQIAATFVSGQAVVIRVFSPPEDAALAKEVLLSTMATLSSGQQAAGGRQ